VTFVNPSSDPLGMGYHVIQSKIAIGSGGFWGKGFLGSTQSQLKFLPEGHTDFVFAVFAEEWGFVGVLVLLALYGFVLFWIVETAYKAKDRLGAPQSGLRRWSCSPGGQHRDDPGDDAGRRRALVLMSYGRSSMLTVFAALGLVMNVRLRRFMLFY
jgi:rod shape determining protein RodA